MSDKKSARLAFEMQQYDGKIPEDVIQSIEKTICLADKHLGKDFIKEMDITNMKLLSRLTFGWIQ